MIYKINLLNITSITLCFTLLFTCKAHELKSQENQDRYNLIGANYIFLGGELNQGLELEYRRLFSAFNLRAAAGINGFNSETKRSFQIMLVEDDGIVNVRHKRKNSDAITLSLGIEKMFDLLKTGELLIGSDVIYSRKMTSTTYLYSKRDYNNEELPTTYENNTQGSYYRYTIDEDLGINLNLGVIFNITDRISLLPKVIKSFEYRSIDQKMIRENGEAMFNENILPSVNGNIYNGLSFSFAINFKV